MALSHANTLTVKAVLSELCGSARIEGPKSDGGAENVIGNTDTLDKRQLLQLADLARQVPNSMTIRRSGKGLCICFY